MNFIYFVVDKIKRKRTAVDEGVREIAGASAPHRGGVHAGGDRG